MMPGSVSKRVAADRLALAADLVAEIRALPLTDRQAFFADRRNIWTADSCLRRSLEALFDRSWTRFSDVRARPAPAARRGDRNPT